MKCFDVSDYGSGSGVWVETGVTECWALELGEVVSRTVLSVVVYMVVAGTECGWECDTVESDFDCTVD